jgi:hypothetical protein
MKKQAYTMIAMIVLVGSMTVAAKAQASGSTQMIANIPFQFSVGNKILPAGEYTVTCLNSASDHTVVHFRSNDAKAAVLVQMAAVIGKSQETAGLIFNRYGNQYFFAQAWPGADSAGLEASKTRAERAARRELANLKQKSETVALRNR